MSDIEDFAESNWRLAEAFRNEVDALLDELIDIEEQRGASIDDARHHRIGEWHRIETLARWPAGEHFLTEEDGRMLRESFKFQTKTGKPDLDKSSLEALKEWADADVNQRWLSFCIYVWARITGGAASEEESVVLFAIAHRALGYLTMSYEKPEQEVLRSFAKKGADALHLKKGHREKRMKIREAWASGKYTSRDICAEQECAAIGMSFSTARKALRGTPDPVSRS